MARVFVGMSGGVDSSVAAALLVEQGHEVTGVYMKNWSEDLPGMHCPWAEDVADAKRVAVGLGIDFRVFDFQKEYKQKVVDYMIREYQAGRTPNPDVMCNQEVKFKLFLDAALAAGAEYIATGHYARVKHVVGGAALGNSGAVASRHGVHIDPSLSPAELTAFRQSSAIQDESTLTPGLVKAPSLPNVTRLLRAHDNNKDQTYFLYRVTSEALTKTMFPLGAFTKAEVREMAKERGLWTASKKESMGICFVGQVGIREFLSEYVETSPGDIIDRPTGAVVGRHDGAIFYTLGQRHGLNVGGGLPYYVVGKDMAKNEVYVSRSIDDDNLWRKELTLADVHWINQPPKDDIYQIRVRHRSPLIDAEVARVNNDAGEKVTVRLSEPQRAVAPGQSAVIYDGEECLGGGIIQTD